MGYLFVVDAAHRVRTLPKSRSTHRCGRLTNLKSYPGTHHSLQTSCSTTGGSLQALKDHLTSRTNPFILLLLYN